MMRVSVTSLILVLGIFCTASWANVPRVPAPRQYRVGPAERRDVEELEIRPPAEIFSKFAGEALMLQCQVNGADDSTDYDIRWFEGNVGDHEIVAQSGRKYVEIPDSSTKKLYITDIEISDDDRYTCSATINGSQQQKSVRLHVMRPRDYD